MDKPKPPEDILDEIMSRTSEPGPSPLPCPPDFDPPPPEDIPLSPMSEDKTSEGKGGADPAAKLLPWMCLVMGAALLVLGISVFQLVHLSSRMDELQEIVDTMAGIDRLREENETLQHDLEELRAQAGQTEQDKEYLEQIFEDASTQRAITAVQKGRLDYLWYIGQFMENGEYRMAALIIVLSSVDRYFQNSYVNSQAVYLNPAQTAQYQAYKQELISKGYLWEDSNRQGFPHQWNPDQNPVMAALGILWCALEAQHILERPEAAASYMAQFTAPQSVPDSQIPYTELLYRTASDYTIGLYEQLIGTLIEEGWLVDIGGGWLVVQPADRTDEYYLPFTPPS